MIHCGPSKSDQVYPTRKKNAAFYKRFEDTNTGKRLKPTKVYRFSGVGDDSKYIYHAFHNTYTGTQKHFDQIRHRVADMMTDRDIVEREGYRPPAQYQQAVDHPFPSQNPYVLSSNVSRSHMYNALASSLRKTAARGSRKRPRRLRCSRREQDASRPSWPWARST